METFDTIKFGITDDFSYVFGKDTITNVITLNFNELLVSTKNEVFIIDYKNKIIKIRYQLKLSTCTIIPYIDFLIGVSIKKGELLFYQINQADHSTSGNLPLLLKKIATKQSGIFHILYSPISQSIITFGSEIKVFDFQYKMNKNVKSKVTISVTNRSTIPFSYDSKNIILPEFDEQNELFLIPTNKGIFSYDLNGKKSSQCSKDPATAQTTFASGPSKRIKNVSKSKNNKIQTMSISREILTYDSNNEMILWGNKSQILQKYDAIRSPVLAIIFIDSENSICLNSCHILFYFNIKTGKTFYYMNLNKRPTRLFLVRLYNEPILCACFGSTLRALNLNIPWHVWQLNIEKTTSITRCNKYMTAARILIQTESSFVKLFSPRDKNLISIQIPSLSTHSNFYFYDRGTIENYIYDSKKQIYDIKVINITNQINFIRDTLFIGQSNGKIIGIDTNVEEHQKELKIGCNASFMTICRRKSENSEFQWCYAVASESSEVVILDYFTYEEISRITVINDTLIQFFYHFESDLIVMVFNQRTIIFDLETAKIIDTLEVSGSRVTSLFSNFLIYGYESGHIRRVKIESRKLFECNDIKLTNKKKRFARSLAKDKKDEVMLKPHSCPITAFSFSPKIWISSGLDGNVVAFNYDFDIVCKISLPLPLRACLIMNGRRDILVATATEIMEIKNDYLFYDLAKKKKAKNSVDSIETEIQGEIQGEKLCHIDDLNDAANGCNNEDEEEEEGADPEVKEIDNFDRIKDEFFLIGKNPNLSKSHAVVDDVSENESESAASADVSRDDMKEIRKFRRSRMAKNKAETISMKSVEKNDKTESNRSNDANSSTTNNNAAAANNNDDDDGCKKENAESEMKQNGSVCSNEENSNSIQRETEISDSNEKEKSNSSNQESDKNLKKGEIDKSSEKSNSEGIENSSQNQSGSKDESNSDRSTDPSKDDTISSTTDSNSANINTSNNDQTADNNGQFGLNSDTTENTGNLDGKPRPGEELDASSDAGGNMELGDSCRNGSDGSGSSLRNEKVGDSLNDSGAKISLDDSGGCNGNEEGIESGMGKEEDKEKWARGKENENTKEDEEEDENAERLINEIEASKDNEFNETNENAAEEETAGNNQNVNKGENPESVLDESELASSKNHDEKEDKESLESRGEKGGKEEESLHNSKENDGKEEEEESLQNIKENEGKEEEDSLRRSKEKGGKEREEDEMSNQMPEEDQEANETSPDDSDQMRQLQSLQQQELEEPPLDSVEDDESTAALNNDNNFNSDDENGTVSKSANDTCPNLGRSPTPPPIRPSLSAASSSSSFSNDSNFISHNRRSRTPSPRRSKTPSPRRSRTPSPRRSSRGISSHFFPPNVIIDKEAVLALYGRGRVEFRPFVEQIQKEFLLNRFAGDEEVKEGSSTRRITLSYVYSLSNSIRNEKQKSMDIGKGNDHNRHDFKLSDKNIDGNDNCNFNDPHKSFELPPLNSNVDCLKTPPRRPLLPPININKSLSPTAYVYNYDNNTETFFNKLDIKNGMTTTTPRRLQACSVRRPLLLIQPPSWMIVKPNVPNKRNQSFRCRRNSPSYQTMSSPRRKLNMNRTNSEISDNSPNYLSSS